MRKSTAAILIAILLVAIFARLLPLLEFVYWGSDAGEYHWLTTNIIEEGHLSTDYNGWGVSYPYFPGFYFILGAPGMFGIDNDAALSLIPPILNSFSIILIFLIAVRIFRDERIGFVASAVLAVSMPYVYTNSHPIPASIGSLLVIATLALLIGPATNRKKTLILLLPLATALVITHHLSTYFLMIAVLVTLLLKSLIVAKFDWKGAVVEIILLLYLFCISLPYWLLYAVPFRENILSDLNVMPWWGPFVILSFALIVWIAIVKLRQRTTWKFVPKFPMLRRCMFLLLIAIIFVFGLTASFTVVNVFGTTISISWQTVLFLTPFLILVAFSAPGRKFLDFSKDGMKPTAWFIAFTISLFVGFLIGAEVLIPYRHMDVIIIPVAIMIGVGMTFMHDLARIGKRKSLVVSSLVTLLIVANIPVAYPPPDIMAGYKEGATPQSLVAISWLPGQVDGLLATDHKASTLAFGFGGINATWDTVRDALLAPDFDSARDEMLNVSSPSGTKRVDYVLVNSDVRAGTQLLPWEPAYKMTNEAQKKFNELPYQRFYDDGYTQVYWVNWGLT